MNRKLLLLGGCLIVASTAALSSNAGAVIPPQATVGPNQVFTASVNGRLGIGTPATIRMACFGPIRPGQTGHPMAGQTVEVFRPEVIVAHNGFTGPGANRIVALFNAPPPAPATTASATSNVTFRRYAVPQAIPTSLLLPCSGLGNVYFVPFPASPLGPARSAVVPLNYVGQP